MALTSLSFPRGRIYNNIIETIGGTPLVQLNKLPFAAGCVATILVKLEFFNPLSSVKDRAALGMIEAAEEQGKLTSDTVLVESTSGNTGIGLAFIASVKNYKLILTMPENMSIERRKLLAFLGAEIELTPAADGMAGALKRAYEIVEENPRAIMLQQFENLANPAIHKKTTAHEIWEDTKGAVDVFVAGVGTGGTIRGVGEFLKEKKNAIKIIAVEPVTSPVLSGGKAGVHNIQGIGANFVPPLLELQQVDEIISIEDEQALTMARQLARQEGILAGISSGAAVAAAIEIAKRPQMKEKLIVALLPDSAERYLSTALFS